MGVWKQYMQIVFGKFGIGDQCGLVCVECGKWCFDISIRFYVLVVVVILEFVWGQKIGYLCVESN